MRRAAIAAVRLRNQRIVAPRFTTAAGVVQWMGAIQAQDFPMAKWAIGVRLAAGRDRDVERALADGKIIRTHLLRPTWHLVSPEDARWLLALTGPRIKASLRGRHRQLELTSEVVRKSFRVFEKLLRDGSHCGRAQIIAGLNKAGINTDENRASHLFLLAELEGIACSGPMESGKPTYMLLDARVPSPTVIPREEALGRLAQRYFRSRGPATLSDFSWWSGLTVREATLAVELVREELRCERIASRPYWMSAAASAPRRAAESLYLLPAYDEYTISYRDRGDVLPMEKSARAVSRNGIFYPLVILNGRAAGTWRRSSTDGLVSVHVELFEPRGGRAARKKLEGMLEGACRRYGRFLEAAVKPTGPEGGLTPRRRGG